MHLAADFIFLGISLRPLPIVIATSASSWLTPYFPESPFRSPQLFTEGPLSSRLDRGATGLLPYGAQTLEGKIDKPTIKIVWDTLRKRKAESRDGAGSSADLLLHYLSFSTPVKSSVSKILDAGESYHRSQRLTIKRPYRAVITFLCCVLGMGGWYSHVASTHVLWC